MEDPSFERLSSERLVLRRLDPSDAEALAAYRSDPKVARYQDWPCPYPLDDARQLIATQSRLAPGTPGTWFPFAVVPARSGILIGDVALRTSPDDAGAGELGFTFAAEHWGRGYATEAVAEVVRYAFETLRMHRLLARTDSRNLSAQRLLDRLRFLRQEQAERTWFKEEWATDWVYTQLETDWQSAGLTAGGSHDPLG